MSGVDCRTTTADRSRADNAHVYRDRNPSSTRPVSRIADLCVLVATSLAVASALHLSGQVSGRGAPFDADHAGVAEAILCLVMVGAAVVLRRSREARKAALFLIGFTIAGFLWGLSITSQGGHLPDIAYHVTVLPLLVWMFVRLFRNGG